MPFKKDKSPVMGLLSKPNAVDLAVGDVHRDFEAETHFGVLRLGPHCDFSRGLNY
jgi:hypothetical protein